MIYTIIIILGILLDRITKVYAKNIFIENPVYTKLINLIYLENKGAAFGILQNKRMFFIILTLVVVTYLLYYFIKNVKTNPKLLNIALSLIISGAIGNFYDRLIHSYVVDFIEFSFINFPIFNIADILVTMGSFLLIVFIIFGEMDGEKNVSSIRK
ncbi:signal peptidase II [Anaerococcus sp. AGMB00486]|uniref:Lipoprotein signal peptidase n=2 Tax=Anaerococcus TaxID=165779 RepID=A0ABX2N7G5_9FIRM|nr:MULTISPECIES: signal peptidase II [Anaerococcus]MDY3005460.1 signal peptidase II [Anaerococcus porci]MSS76888.1 signal peptidase II [Anaerococcus porci]NVF10628.1 signal peptidase II [Anaerococcus faecalis]